MTAERRMTSEGPKEEEILASVAASESEALLRFHKRGRSLFFDLNFGDLSGEHSSSLGAL